jgi:hypothetical protein
MAERFQIRTSIEARQLSSWVTRHYQGSVTTQPLGYGPTIKLRILKLNILVIFILHIHCYNEFVTYCLFIDRYK